MEVHVRSSAAIGDRPAWSVVVRWFAAPLTATALCLLLAAPAAAEHDRVLTGPLLENFELVGHDPLRARGQNSALAIHRGFAYIGSRADGSQQHPVSPGVLIVDVRDPSAPQIVGEIGPPLGAEPGTSSRELRVWPERDLLIVMHIPCGFIEHTCEFRSDDAPSSLRFFDISDPTRPRHLSTYQPAFTPHEFFLWVDPARPDQRALLFLSVPTDSTTGPSMVVVDISQADRGVFVEYPWVADFTVDDGTQRRLHSMSVSPDGSRTHLAFSGAGYLMLDSRAVTADPPSPTFTLLTPPAARFSWGDPGAHSAVELPGGGFVLLTEEVYGDIAELVLAGDHGCPWGWVRIVDVRDPTHPTQVSEVRLPQNEESFCDTPEGRDPGHTLDTSYSTHNPTVGEGFAFVSWHAGGLVAIDLTDPTSPQRAGRFKPQPLPAVSWEDPALTFFGVDKVAVWSYPIVVDGLVYVVDVRNGLYVLRYTGPGAERVARVRFLEGNSNLGQLLAGGQGHGSAGAGAAGTSPAAEPAPATPALPATGASWSWGVIVVGILLGWRGRRGDPGRVACRRAEHLCVRVAHRGRERG